MSENKQYYIGIDGGATYIRVAVSDCEGNILSHIKHYGGAAIYKNDNPQKNMHDAIMKALEKADVRPSEIFAIGAGIACFDSEEDLKWVNTLIDIDGLDCTVNYVNDSVVAHFGAFHDESGIIAICGTGSIVLGVDEFGCKIRNFDFDNYAYSAARHLTQNLINRVVKKENDLSDREVVSELLNFFGMESVDEIEPLASVGKELKDRAKQKQFGEFAKFITDNALRGSRLSQIVCNDAAGEICYAIELVGNHFNHSVVDVSLIGSVANSKYIFERISEILFEKGYRLKQDVLLPEFGGVILALKSAGVMVDETKLERLRSFM